MKLIITEWCATGWKVKKERDLADMFGRPDLEAYMFIARQYNSTKLANGEWTKSAALFVISYNDESFLMEAHKASGDNWAIGQPNLSIFEDREIGVFIAEALLAGVESEV